MAENTKIGWTEATWNPVTGCTKISAGCANCYAERMSKRLKAMGQANYVNGFKVTTHPHMLERPLHWRKPRMIFVNSMSDLFHEEVPDGFRDLVLRTMKKAGWHKYQILTKRPANAARYLVARRLPYHVWLGASVEDQRTAGERISDLVKCSVGNLFLSMEPLLGPVDIPYLDKIDGVIVGGETGPGARPMHPDWVRSIRDQCAAAGVPYFFKGFGEWVENGPSLPQTLPQTATLEKKRWGRLALDGKWHEYPMLESCAVVPAEHCPPEKVGSVCMIRAGKQMTGRVLDGRVHDDLPWAVKVKVKDE